MGRREVDPRYALIERRAREVLDADERVVRVEVTGSQADGTADEWSDLDLKVIVRDDAIEAFLSEWREWMGKITPTVLIDRSIAPFIVNAITDEGLVFDVSVWRESAPDWVMPPGFTVGMISGRRYASYDEALQYAVEERLRGLAGPLIKLLKRGDYVAMLGGLGHMLGLLMTVLLAETGVVPDDPRHPARNLTDAQRAVIDALPPVAANYDALLAFELALARHTITRARPLVADWPTALEAVAKRNLRVHLGVEVDWLDG